MVMNKKLNKKYKSKVLTKLEILLKLLIQKTITYYLIFKHHKKILDQMDEVKRINSLVAQVKVMDIREK